MTAHDFAFMGIDGGTINLAEFAGSAVLIVNTASQCGFTSQYRDLQGLWDRYKNRGLVVLGVPSNDFGGQEPGTEAEIREFCAVSYSVDFPMTGKATVIGGDAHPFYRWVSEQAGEDAAPRWNFHKYLLGPDGALVEIYSSRVGPLEKAVTDRIDELLDA